MAIVNVPRSLRIELPTVIVNVPDVLPITIELGVYVIVPHVKPGIAAGATSVTEHVFPVGMPVTVAGAPGATDRDPVNAEPFVSRPQS